MGNDKEVSQAQQEKIRRYKQLVDKLSPKSDMVTGLWRAFWVGGAICLLGQGLMEFFSRVLLWGATSAATATSICLIFLSALLTGVGVYDKIGKYAGAGSIVPITGFSTRSSRRRWNLEGKAWSWAWARSCSRSRGRCWCMASAPPSS